MLYHKLYWAYELLITIVQLAFVLAFNIDKVHLVIPLIKILDMLALLVYSLCFQEEHFEKELPLMADSPSVINRQTNETVETELVPIDKPLFVEFNSIPIIHFKGTVKYEFNIAVYGDGTSPPQIISRFEEDFTRLQKDMERALNYSEDLSFPQLARKGSLSHIGEGELKVKTYEEFMIRVTRSSDYYVEPLLDFLGITG